MLDYNESVKHSLQRLMALLSDREVREFGQLTEGTSGGKANGSFVIEYPSNIKGLEFTKKFLEKLQEGGFIKKSDLPEIDQKVIHSDMNIYPINREVKLNINEHRAKITFTPNGDYTTILSGLGNSIKSAYDDAKCNTMWVDNRERARADIKLPAGAEEVMGYLKKKVEDGFPEKHIDPKLREVNVTYSKYGQSGSVFTVISANKLPTDIGNLEKTIDELNRILGGSKPKKVARMIVNEKNTKIGFTVSENPVYLLGYVKQNDPDNFPKIEKKASVER